MTLHQLASVTIGVPDVPPVAAYYADFGLQPHPDGSFSTTDGGRQLFVQQSPMRRLVQMTIGVDHQDDVDRSRAALFTAGHQPPLEPALQTQSLSVVEPNTGVRVVLAVMPRLNQPMSAPEVYNGPGRPVRQADRAPAVLRSEKVRPRKLGHVVVTTTNLTATAAFFVDGLGFKVSDLIGEVGVFLRCSTDHHNLLVLQAPAVYLHHTAWQVDDVDEIGRAATAMLEDHPDRHVWGLGRHHAGSNFFWYLRDPAGNYSEYYADLDYIPENAIWTPQSHGGRFGLYNWGPPPPASFLTPNDLMELAAAQRSVSV